MILKLFGNPTGNLAIGLSESALNRYHTRHVDNDRGDNKNADSTKRKPHRQAPTDTE